FEISGGCDESVTIIEARTLEIRGCFDFECDAIGTFWSKLRAKCDDGGTGGQRSGARGQGLHRFGQSARAIWDLGFRDLGTPKYRDTLCRRTLKRLRHQAT